MPYREYQNNTKKSIADPTKPGCARTTPGFVISSDLGGGRQIKTGESTPPQGGPAPILNMGTCKGTSSKTSTALYRIVGWSKMRSMLQPAHPYFAGKAGYVVDFPAYTHPEGSHAPDLLYPKIKVDHPDNPYRRHLLNARAGNKAVERFFVMVDYQDVTFNINKIVLPFQVKISEELARRDAAASKGRPGVNAAWTMFKRFLDRLDQELPGFTGSAWRVNLHPWSTKRPHDPRYHFHALKSDRVLRDGKLAPGPSTGKKYPFTQGELLIVKAIWLQVQVNFCKYHAIQGAFDDEIMVTGRVKGYKGLLAILKAEKGTGKGRVNVYVDPETIHLRPGDAKDGRRDFAFAIKYNSRHWSENYAEYVKDYPESPDPPQHLLGYNNKSRLFGWWADLVKYSGDNFIQKRQRISPLDGAQIERRRGPLCVTAVAGFIQSGKVGGLEVLRGKPVLVDLSALDSEWLRGCIWVGPVKIPRPKVQKYRREAYDEYCEMMADQDLVDWYDENGGV